MPLQKLSKNQPDPWTLLFPRAEESKHARPEINYRDPEQFNRLVGLPRHPRTGAESQLFQYQYDILNCDDRFIQIVKARKTGISEIAIRRFAQRCFTTYAGYQVLFISQSDEFAVRLMIRFQELFENSLLRDSVVDYNQSYTKLDNGTEIFSRPTTAKGLRSYDRCKAFLWDEAAHSGFVDDFKLYGAVRPGIINTQGDVMLVSTPNGRRGVFASIFFNDDTFRKFVLPYSVAPGLIDPQELERDRKTLGDALFAQEYECSFEAAGAQAIEEKFIAQSENLDSAQEW